jgi:hypothetical protein
MNPGDLRVVMDTCGKSGCHTQAATNVNRSTMHTVTGKLDAMLYAVGMPRPADLIAAIGSDSTGKRLATTASAHVDNPDWDPATAPPGSVPHVHALETKDRETETPYGTFSESDMYGETINKLCGTCHLGHNGTNDKFGNFRSAGCTACHMAYDWSGQSQSGDPMINKQEPTYPAAYAQIQYPERPHAARHVLKRNPTAQECLACHTGSARTVFQFMGIRTDDNRDLTRARAAGSDVRFEYSKLVDNQQNPQARLHGFSQDQLIEYEDLDRDGQDDTPPDVHYLAGLECVDCHTAADLHGDGNIYSRQTYEVKVRCVNCHGNLEFAADPDADNNPINALYRQTQNVNRKYLWKFDKAPAYGQTGYPTVTAAGVWLRTKTKGEWKYVPQIRWGVQWDPGDQDCFGDGRRIDPRDGRFVCTPQSSIAHGRWQGLNENAGDFDDGVGPRPGVEVVAGDDGQTAQVRFGFSHLGEPASKPNENPSGGLDCTACHGTWHNMRYGNHLGLKDMENGQRLYDWDRISGQYTLGTQGWFDFTFVDMLDQQLGITEKGKIGWFAPTRLKLFFRALVLDPGKNATVDFMREVGDADFPWKTYRDRVGYGNLMCNTQAGISGAPGWDPVCIEPGGMCDQDQRKNLNGGLGHDTMAPHASQLRAKDCTACHMDETASNAARISAVYGWNPQGFTPATSAYLREVKNIQTGHGNYSTASGFTIADDGITHKLDWMVDEQTGYPLVYTLHSRADDGKDGRPERGYDTYDPEAAGPITKPMIELMKRVRVRDVNPP